MKNKQLILGSILSYAQQIVSVLLGLFYTPFLLSSLGKSEYGLYSTVLASISMISILNLGLSNGYIKYYSIYEKENNQRKKYNLNGLFLTIFSTLGIIALIIGLFISNNLTIIFKNGLSNEEYKIAKILAILLSVNISLSFPSSVFSSIIIAHERFVVSKLIGMFSSVLAPCLTIPLLIAGYKSVVLVSVSLLISIISNIFIICYVVLHLRERFIFNEFEKGLLKSLIIYILPITINILIDQVNLNIDKILLARFRGTSDVAVYNVGYTLYGLYISLSVAISGVFVPRIHAIVNRNNGKKDNLSNELTKLFIRVGRIQFELLLLVISGFIFFGMDFITVHWVGTGYKESYYVFLLLAIPATVPLIQNLGIEIQRAENKHQFRSIVYGLMAIVNLIMSIFLCQKYGAIGSAIGTAISFVLCNGIIINIYYHKKCYINIIEFWRNILKIVISVCPTIIIWLLIRNYFNLSSILEFILGIVIYTLLYCGFLWMSGMNEEEKELIKNCIIAIKRKLIR